MLDKEPSAHCLGRDISPTVGLTLQLREETRISQKRTPQLWGGERTLQLRSIKFKKVSIYAKNHQ